MMRVSIGLTAAYVFIMAAVMAHISDAGSKVSGVMFGDSLFSAPMIIAFILSLIMRRAEARRVMLTFEIGYSIVSLLIFISTFVGEHDAQYQLALLFIPLIGFPAVVIAGIAGAFLRAKERLD